MLRMKQWLRLFASLIALVVVTGSTLLVLVDSVAIVFAYFSLLFVTLSLPITNNKKVLQLYVVIFLLAHITMGWRIYTDFLNSQKPQSTLSSQQTINLFILDLNKQQDSK